MGTTKKTPAPKPTLRVPVTVEVKLRDEAGTVVNINFMYGSEINPHIENPWLTVITRNGFFPSGKAEIHTTWRDPNEDD